MSVKLNARSIFSTLMITVILNLLFPGTAILENQNLTDPPLRTLYVATNGNDQWSGTLPAPDATENDGPFATLQKALDVIRGLKQDGSKEVFTVLVRGGVYHLGETLVLEPVDSGTETHPFTFKAFGDETPILRGTKKITDFIPYKGEIYQADMVKTANEPATVRQLFVDGTRQVPARFPNADKQDPVGGGFLYVADSGKTANKLTFSYKEGTIPEYNLQGAELVIYPGKNWTNNILEVGSIDRNNHIITLSQEATHDIEPGNRYYFQSILEALDSPGEWHLDYQKQRLYFWPPQKTALESTYIPTLDTIVRIEGDEHTGTPSDIRFEGFTVEGCEGSAFTIIGAKRVVIARCTIFNAGKHGIEIQDGFDNRAVGNDIYNVGGRGIILSGGNHETLTPAENRAENNYVHHIGNIYKNNSGIECRGVGNIVSHNLIHSTPRAGIWFDGNNHLIEYNYIHHVNQETDDAGMIYTSQLDWTKRGNGVQFNYLHDSGGYGRDARTGEWRTPFNTYGIYLDDWTSGTTVFGNIIRKTVNGGILIHGGRDNIIENNVIIEGGFQGQMVYSGWPVDDPIAQKWLPKMFEKVQQVDNSTYDIVSPITSIEQGAKMSGNSFVRNIIYYSGKHEALYGIYNHIDLATTKSDYNIIFHGDLPLLVPFLKETAEQQWIMWKSKGLDQNSIIADPLFYDMEQGDFTLSTDSPAHQLGFQSIPFEKIGLYTDTLRASWPSLEVFPPVNVRVLD